MTRRKKAQPSSERPSRQPTLHGLPHNPDVDVEPRRWTQAGAEAHVRSLGLRCQGPQIPEAMERWQQLMADGKEEEARQVVTRAGCGQDFGETVLAEPFDGQEHESTCPKCGTVTRWRSPVFEGLETKAKGRAKGRSA